MKEYRINVYADAEDGYVDKDTSIIARVRYNQALDYWNGSNWQNGGTGCHLGITKLRDGRYVLIRGSDWQGSRDYGYVVSPSEALQEILKSGNSELLETKKFAELKELAASMVSELDED